MAKLAKRLAQKKLLAPGVSQSDAAHTMWVLTSFDAFDLLYNGRGLSAEEVTRILVATAERAVLGRSRGS
jgi:hypothetical protein